LTFYVRYYENPLYSKKQKSQAKIPCFGDLGYEKQEKAPSGALDFFKILLVHTKLFYFTFKL